MSGTVAAVCDRGWPPPLATCKTFPDAYGSGVSIQEIKSEIEALPVDERKRLAAFLVSLRHKEMAEYRSRMARIIDDKTNENWATLEELDQRLEA
ncbi:MAG: hypothetical protein ACO3JG_05040 [Luteolibacter sp.]